MKVFTVVQCCMYGTMPTINTFTYDSKDKALRYVATCISGTMKDMSDELDWRPELKSELDNIAILISREELPLAMSKWNELFNHENGFNSDDLACILGIDEGTVS